MIKEMMYFPLWYGKNCIFRQHHPLQTVLFITDYCNLSCKHCSSSGHAGTRMKPYVQIQKELSYAYGLGSRFVDFEGGEPTLWRDGAYDLNDLYRLAHRIGYFSCTLTTNGQHPFHLYQADQIWVSVDGFNKVHDRIRGEGTFARLDKHIRESGRKVSINMAINRINYGSVADTIRYAANHPCISSISLNFHTPYPETEKLMLPWDKRCHCIDKIIRMKKQGYPVMNSISGLKIMKKKNFPKDCWVSNFILLNGRRLSGCGGKELGLCEDCGFCMAGEMYSVLRLRPDTILAAMKLRMKRR